MSYDVSVEAQKCPTCGRGDAEYVGNYTYNCAAMMSAAVGFTLGSLHGKVAATVAEELTRAVEVMRADPGKYQAMNPSNGWGDYDSWLEYLDKIIAVCRSMPAGTLRVA